MRFHELLRKHQGQPISIVGMGPSLLNLRPEHLGKGPIIAIYEAVHKVESFNLPNTIYSLQKDGITGIPREAILLLHAHESGKLGKPAYEHYYVFDNEQDFGLQWHTDSGITALFIANALGCKDITMLCFDASMKNDRRRAIFENGQWSIREKPDLILPDLRNMVADFSKRLDLKTSWVIPDGPIALDRYIPAICAVQSKKPKVVFCIPIPKGDRPYPQTIAALEASVPLVEEAGFEHGYTETRGNPYISGARADMTRKAMNANADMIVYIDYDVAWKPQDLVKLLKTEGDVVAGTYRCKTDDDQYMGVIYTDENGRPICRADGAIKAKVMPAGFLKVTSTAIDKFMRHYPELCYGPQYALSVDLFHHGAHKGLWWGEDYAFCRNWEECGGENWLVPNMDVDHWQRFKDEKTGEVTYKCFEGNYHEFLLRCPGGSKAA